MFVFALVANSVFPLVRMADPAYSLHSNRWEISCKPKHRHVASRFTRVSAAKYTHKPRLLSKMMLLAQTAPGILLLTASVEGVSNRRICQSSAVLFQGSNLVGLIYVFCQLLCLRWKIMKTMIYIWKNNGVDISVLLISQ